MIDEKPYRPASHKSNNNMHIGMASIYIAWTLLFLLWLVKVFA